jgi:cell division protein FtsL
MTAQAMPYGDSQSRGLNHDLTGVAGPRIFPLVFFVLGVVVVFFSMIFLRISLDETAFKLDRIETEIGAEQSRQLDLRYDLAGLQDPLRIATEAQRIGLVYPQERISIVVITLVNDAQILEVDVPVRAMAGGRP